MILKNNPPNQYPVAILGDKTLSSDTIVFTSFISVIAHILLILGISFAFTSPQDSASVELVLLQQEAKDKPYKSEFSARANQKGSGEDDKNLAARILHSPLLVSPDLRPQSRLVFSDNLAATEPSFNRDSGGKNELTSINSRVYSNQGPRGALANSQLLGVESTQLQAEIASVEAYLGELEREYAKKPKIKRYTSIAAQRAVEADYIHRWVKKIEVVGNLNYPSQAIERKISGSLRLLVIVSNEGRIIGTHILKGSGHKILDDAARQIAHLAAPFGSFPDELKRETDIIEIVRTWNFFVEGGENGLKFGTQSIGI